MHRRRILGTAAVGLGVLELGFAGLARAQDAAKRLPATVAAAGRPDASFKTIKQVNAGLLNIGYAETGPQNGPVVILLHGWPYDIHSYVDVAPLLAASGYRVIVPHLRGHGTTRFLDASTFRNGQQAAVVLDTIALMDALKIDKAILAGYDWGSRTACVIAALWPERCKAIVSANGYIVNNLEFNRHPMPPKAEHARWYQFYFATERGRAGLEANRRDLARVIWKENSPKWNFDDATFERSAASFDNPDYVAIVIHNYRWRLSLADGERQYDVLERRLAEGPVITVPAITLDGDANGVAPATDGAGYARKFAGRYAHRIVSGAGHNLAQEAPKAFADAVIEVASY
ncbi:alpha/beta hydrolase [Paraburkholderia sp. IMGN_8]|uniref:alpha/beta fold hydrolase n=1 Tax=Paraburkholderia sp. IMGN_8 TaxID=3136564 RepID=UPI0031018B1E